MSSSILLDSAAAVEPGDSTGTPLPILFSILLLNRLLEHILKQERRESVCHSGSESLFPCSRRQNLFLIFVWEDLTEVVTIQRFKSKLRSEIKTFKGENSRGQ